MAKQKVFCIGFQKTGTTSMNTALKKLGYSVASVYGAEMSLADFRENYIQDGLKLAAKFDAVEDMPWPLLYQELDKKFPNSKFILTVRETDAWLKSICNHFGSNPDHMQMLTYGEDFAAPIGNEDHYTSVYEKHNQGVRAYFKDRPKDLLILNLSEGDTWTKICDFLNVSKPDSPFPKANTMEHRNSLGYRIKTKLKKLFT